MSEAGQGIGAEDAPNSTLYPVLTSAEITDQPMSWLVADHEVVSQSAVMNFIGDEIQSPAGETLSRQYTTHFGAVAVVALDDADRVVVVRQYRHPALHKFLEIPAGLLDLAGEDPLVAAKRELAEEAMLEADTWKVLVDAFVSPGCSDEQIRIYLATGLHRINRPANFLLEGEEADMDIRLVPLQDLVAGIYGGKIQNLALVTGVLAAAYGRESARNAQSPWPARDVLKQRSGVGFLVH